MKKQPNIIFIFSDQQRWDTLGCYGQTLPLTPRLDALTETGVLFEQAFTPQPVCGPARASLQTGKYATEVNCPTNHRMLPLNEKTMAHYLSAAGYEVGYLGKWHLASFGPRDGADDYRVLPVPRERRGGYEDFWLASDCLEFTSHGYDGHMFDGDGNRRDFPEGRFRADAQTDWLLEYLETRELDRPFFLFNSYIEPHHQNDRGHYEGPKGSKERYANFRAPADLTPGVGDWEEEYPDYLGCINAVDTNVGRIVDKLEELGIAEDTLIVYTSDHGSHFRTRPVPGPVYQHDTEYKRTCFEACVRIPMILHGAGLPQGKRVEQLVSLLDLAPTLLDFSGQEKAAGMRGDSLKSLIENPGREWRSSVYIQISESQDARALRTSEWKYCVRALEGDGLGSTQDSYVEDHLYNLIEDPHEQHNLVTDPAHEEVRAALAEKMKVHMHEAGEKVAEIEPALELV